MDTDDSPQFDEIIHAPIRLRICGLLYTYSPMRFDVVRDTLEISDATCSKHLKVLAEHGYVILDKKAGDDRGYRLTWARMTGEGRRAFERHVAALRRIAAGEV